MHGSSVMSASDDRTVRLWNLDLRQLGHKPQQSEPQAAALPQQFETQRLRASQVLHGHTARIWDCYFGHAHNIVATASEDCTARYGWHFETVYESQHLLVCNVIMPVDIDNFGMLAWL